MRRDIMRALSAGTLRVIEASWIAAVTPRRIRQWCRAEGINPKQRRAAHLQAQWQRALRRERMRSAGIKPRRRTKTDLRKLGDRAVADFEKRKGK